TRPLSEGPGRARGPLGRPGDTRHRGHARGRAPGPVPLEPVKPVNRRRPVRAVRGSFSSSRAELEGRRDGTLPGREGGGRGAPDALLGCHAARGPVTSGHRPATPSALPAVSSVAPRQAANACVSSGPVGVRTSPFAGVPLGIAVLACRTTTGCPDSTA